MKTGTSRIASDTVARLTVCTTALALMPVAAHAYLDPGTGSLIFQSLLAILFGIGVAFRQMRAWIARVWAFILRRPPPDSASSGQAAKDDDK